MRTKLSVFCDKVIEASWLAAAIITPLFFNLFSRRIFEPDKITLLRSIALLMLATWLIKLLESSLPREKRGDGAEGKISIAFLRTPLVTPALILSGVYILTTITSISPNISFWGSYERLQGTYTLISYVVIFLLTLQTLRSREQLERLITIMLLTSLPISLYGLIQHYGLDPIPWATDFAGRVPSSMGNPIFVGAYLIMVVPLTIKRLIDSLSALLTGKRIISSSILTAFYLFLLIAQLMCIVFTQSRGPFMGLMGGLFFFFLLLTISRGKRGLALMVLALAIVFLLFFIVLNLPQTPLASIQEMRYIGRMSRIFGTETRTGKERALIWQGAVNMIAADPVRTLIGYGPESMDIAFPAYQLPELVRMAGLGRRPDRCHNETFDFLVTSGLMGFGVYLLLFGSLFYYGLKWLGLVDNPWQRNLFVALLGIGGSLGTLIPWLIERNLRFAGVGIPMGIVAALALYLAVSLFQRGDRVKDSYRQTMLIALFSAVIAHFIEIQFGIAIVPTRTYFWLCAAMMVVVALFLRRESVQGPAGVSDMVSTWNKPLISRSLLVGLILMTMGFALVNNKYPLSANGFSVPILFFLTWLYCGLMILVEVRQENSIQQKKASWTYFLLTYSLCSLGLFFLFLIFHIPNLLPDGDPAIAIVVYYLFLFTTIISIAATLLRGLILPSALWQHTNWWLYAILMVGVIMCIFATNLNVIRADIYHKLGLAYGHAEQWDKSIALQRRAIELASYEDHYYPFLGQAYLRKAELHAERRSVWFEEARKAFEMAKRISPFNPDHYRNLGSFYYYWAEVTVDPTERLERLSKSLEHYRQTIAMSPYDLGQLVRHSMIKTHLLIGHSYAEVSEFDRAAQAFSEAIEINFQEALQIELKAVEDSPNSFMAHRNLAMLYQQLGQTGEALVEVERAKDLAPEREKAGLDALMAWLEIYSE